MNLALPGLADLGTPELIIIILVILLLFGGKKLPEMARGTGRALRIFKAETKGLIGDGDKDGTAATTQSQLPQQGPAVQPPPVPQPWPTQQPVQPVQPGPVEDPPRPDTER